MLNGIIPRELEIIECHKVYQENNEKMEHEREGNIDTENAHVVIRTGQKLMRQVAQWDRDDIRVNPELLNSLDTKKIIKCYLYSVCTTLSSQRILSV